MTRGTPDVVPARLCDAAGRPVSLMTSGDLPHPSPPGRRRRPAIAPTTRLGNWAVGLAAAGVALNGTWRLLGPLGGFPALALGVAGGIVALVAVFRRGERAVSVFAAVLPFIGVLLFLLAELLIGHD
jgi:hypothetical protein